MDYLVPMDWVTLILGVSSPVAGIGGAVWGGRVSAKSSERMQINSIYIDEWKKLQGFLVQLRDTRSEYRRETDGALSSFDSLLDESFNFHDQFYDERIMSPYANYLESLSKTQDAVYEYMKAKKTELLTKTKAASRYMDDIVKAIPPDELDHETHDEYIQLQQSLKDLLDNKAAEETTTESSDDAVDAVEKALGESIRILSNLCLDYRKIIGSNGKIDKEQNRKFQLAFHEFMKRENQED